MLTAITSLLKPRHRASALPVASTPDPTDMHLAGRGKERLAIAKLAVDLVRSGGAWTARDLCLYLTGAYDPKIASYINAYLAFAWEAGEFARAEIHQRPGQQRPSQVRYAADWKML